MYYNSKISEIENKITTDHDKYTTQEFKLAAENVTAVLAQVNLASKSNIVNFIKKTDLNKNILKELSKKDYRKQYQQKD